MFKKTSFFKNNKGVIQHHVGIRFQYFYHYWHFAGDKNNYLFIDETRMESHRLSLMLIENQLETNFRNSFTNFKSLFENNSLFSQINIISQISNNRRNIQNLINFYNPSGIATETQKRNTYLHNKVQIISLFNILKINFLDQYYSKVVKLLIAVISSNRPITNQVKYDIRFLVNAIIIDLNDFGYNMNYIMSIPDILFDFDKYPYKKDLHNFENNKQKYEKYKISVYQNLSLKNHLLGLINIISKRKKKGFCVFKINSLSLIKPKEITIGDIIFYNPQLTRMVNNNESSKHWKKWNIEAENFCSQKELEIGTSSVSKCNAIVPMSYISAEDIESKYELHNAFHKVQNALNILNNILNPNGVYGMEKGNIEIHKHFKLSSNNRIQSISIGILYESTFAINLENYIHLKAYKFRLKFLEKIGNPNRVNSTLFEIYSIQSKMKSNDELFNFKDLWIPLESLMDKIELKETILDCLYIDYKINFPLYVKLFLNINLQENLHFLKDRYWALNNNELEKLGLNIKYDAANSTKKFLNKYKQVPKDVPIEIVKDILSKIDDYLNPTIFKNSLKIWVESIIDEVYLARNMEVHSNLNNLYSIVKLKTNFFQIIETMLFRLVICSNKNNYNDIQSLQTKIKNIASSL